MYTSCRGFHYRITTWDEQNKFFHGSPECAGYRVHCKSSRIPYKYVGLVHKEKNAEA